MKHSIQKSMGNEAGFTLVELAVVMVIIGLLIGGILKGQEMIANAQLNATVAQVKSVEAATSTFRDIYDAFPGDMSNAATRLPNCTGTCSAPTGAAVGNTILDSLPLATPGAESTAFFPQIVAAELLGGINANSFIDADITGNELRPGYTDGTAALGINTSPRSGHYIGIVLTGTAATPGLKPIDAARMDRKLDDGDPSTGSVGAAGTAAGCGTAAAPATGGNPAVVAAYSEGSQAIGCASFVRIQS